MSLTEGLDRRTLLKTTALVGAAAVITSKKTTVLAQSAPPPTAPNCYGVPQSPCRTELAPKSDEVSTARFAKHPSHARAASLQECNQRTILPCATKKTSSRDG